MKLAFGADHAGFELKNHLVAVARDLGHEVLDLGTHSPESVDYADFAEAVANAVVSGTADLGVVLCSNGVGISITANKVPGIRCALCHTSWGAARARQHVNANVLALGAWEIGRGVAEDILRAFLANEFEGGRHERRVAKLHDVERRGIAKEAASS
ncbi:ribose 5-phosphate isomerase B [Tepidiforma sp.]|uniref:ribose 5-phosphate isomerase B n=1 Tax=Tepidiforma sp. TaxID=2682230 RepID=UPI002ADDDC4A|nr:ribose 5-phosphate isomerase B [Tepidiforma sp.]